PRDAPPTGPTTPGSTNRSAHFCPRWAGPFVSRHQVSWAWVTSVTPQSSRYAVLKFFAVGIVKVISPHPPRTSSAYWQTVVLSDLSPKYGGEVLLAGFSVSLPVTAITSTSPPYLGERSPPRCLQRDSKSVCRPVGRPTVRLGVRGKIIPTPTAKNSTRQSVPTTLVHFSLARTWHLGSFSSRSRTPFAETLVRATTSLRSVPDL